MTFPTLGELRSWLSIDDSYDDATLAATKAAAEAGVEAYCGWRFSTVTATRRFAVERNTAVLYLGRSPLATTAGCTVLLDKDDDGTYETTLATADWQAEPIDGLGDTGEPGWPYTRLRALNGLWFPASPWRRATVQITGTWGWAAVPEAVRQATLIAAAWLWSNKSSPTGVQMTEFGPMSIRQMPQAERLLTPYRRGTAMVGIGGSQ